MKLRAKKCRKKRRQESRNRPRHRGLKYWAALSAMSALMACAPIASKPAAFAAAQKIRGASEVSYWLAQSQIQAQPVRHFDIPPGTMETVLAAFQNLTGWSVQVPNDAMRSLASPGVSGNYTAEQALKQLLANTGITYRFTAAETVMLELSGLAASVEVMGRASPSSPKYTEPLRDTPQTITIIPKAVIEEQGATTLRDVLRHVPGLTITAGEGGAPAGDNLTLRGFSARNDIFVDGVRDLSPQSRDPFNLEQVEVIKGPGSAYTGRGSAGGSINLVSKSPGTDPFFGGTLNFGTDRTKRLTTDVNLPLKKLNLGERTAFRLNFLAHESGVAGRDVVENQRWGIAPSLAFGTGTTTRLILSYAKLKQENIPDYGIPWVTATHNVLADFRDQPAPVLRDSFYGMKSRDFEKIGSDNATVRFERDFSDTFTLRNQLRYSRATRNSVTTAPRFASNDSLVINRNGPSWITEDKVWDNQTDLRARFSTSGIQHSLVTGAALTRENNIRQARTVTGTPTTTLFDPNPDQPFTGAITLNPIIGDITGNSQALYLFDTAKLGEKFELNGGLRWDRFDVNGVNTANAPVTRVDKMLSWRAGAVFKPQPQGSIYASYSTSLSPSLEGLSYGTANTAIEPEKTYNLEAGSKWDLFRERLSLSGAIFRVEKTNARTPGLLPDDPPQVLQGRQRVQGVELGVSGSITRELRVFGAYTLLDTRVVKSNTPAEMGKRIQNAPRNSFNLWTTYQYKNLTLGGGARFVGRRFGNNTNTRQVESHWTLDALASYPITRHIDLRLNLYNLTDEYYFDRLGGGHLIPGPARSANVSLGFRFSTEAVSSQPSSFG
jgi:catecholate siderophore receptor